MSSTSQHATEPPFNSVGAGKSQLLKWTKEATRCPAEPIACGRFPEDDREALRSDANVMTLWFRSFANINKARPFPIKIC
jgi:hypothetical protein